MLLLIGRRLWERDPREYRLSPTFSKTAAPTLERMFSI